MYLFGFCASDNSDQTEQTRATKFGRVMTYSKRLFIPHSIINAISSLHKSHNLLSTFAATQLEILV